MRNKIISLFIMTLMVFSLLLSVTFPSVRADDELWIVMYRPTELNEYLNTTFIINGTCAPGTPLVEVGVEDDLTGLYWNVSSSQWEQPEGLEMYTSAVINGTNWSWDARSVKFNTTRPHTWGKHYCAVAYTETEKGLQDGISTGLIDFYMYAPNTSPVLSGVSPLNNSINLPLSVDWKINLFDANSGDLMNYTFQSHNIYSVTNSSVSSGTYDMPMSSLSYSTVYRIYANVTDGINWTRKWFEFTTLNDTAPAFTNEVPFNGTTGMSFSFDWTVDMHDDKPFDWNISCAGQYNTGTGETNGTKTLSLSGLGYSTVYTVNVTITDGIKNTYGWFTFTTNDDTAPNTPILAYPNDLTTDISVNAQLGCIVYDADGDSMDIYFYVNGNLVDTNLGVPNSSSTNSMPLSLNYNADYSWYVIANDSILQTQSLIYNFTTEMMSINIIVIYPVNGSILSSFNHVTGTCDDPNATLEMWFIDITGGKFWNWSGGDWTAMPLSYGTIVGATTWSISSGFPSSLIDGHKYAVFVTANDSGNYSFGTSIFTYQSSSQTSQRMRDNLGNDPTLAILAVILGIVICLWAVIMVYSLITSNKKINANSIKDQLIILIVLGIVLSIILSFL